MRPPARAGAAGDARGVEWSSLRDRHEAVERRPRAAHRRRRVDGPASYPLALVRAFVQATNYADRRLDARRRPGQVDDVEHVVGRSGTARSIGRDVIKTVAAGDPLVATRILVSS